MRSVALRAVLALAMALPGASASGDSAAELVSKSRQALAALAAHDKDVPPLLAQAAGVLVLPDLVKLGFGVGGEYGEGVLLIEDEAVAYYAAVGASFGLQLGAQYKSQVIVFLTREALVDFRNTQGWEIGVDASVALFEAGADASIDTLTASEPVVGFVFSNEGLMYDLSLEGSKISRIAR